MKLTLDARLVTSSGIGVYVKNIIKSDHLRGYDIKILCRSADYSYVRSLCARASLVNYDTQLYSINELVNTPLKTIGSHIFWSPHYNVPVINFASKLKVVTIHDVFHLAYYHTLSAVQKMYAKIMINRAIKSDLIFTVSEFSKSEIIKFTDCKADNIKVIYNGIDFHNFNFRSSEEIVKKVLKTYKVDLPYILFVGNVKPHKNLKTALQGFKDFVLGFTGFKDYKFVIVGKREGFITGDKEIELLLSHPFYSSRLVFTEWVADEDLPVLYQNASTFIFPSVYEGFGFPPLEAMAARCPVISSNSACMPEIYEDAVLYFNPANKGEIANALFTVLTNSELRKTLVEKGLKQANKYNWEEAISNKIRFIEEYAS